MIWPAVPMTLILAGLAAPRAEEAHFTVETTTLDGLLAEVSAPSDPVEVGVPVVFRASLSGPGHATAVLARPDALGAFDLLDLRENLRAEIRSAGARSEGVLLVELTMSTLDSGSVTPDPIAVRWKVDGVEREGTIAFPAISVTSLLPAEVDPQVFRDIAGEIEIRGPFSWWPWAAGAIAVTGVAALAWRVLGARPAVPQTADEWALAQLARLEAAGLPARREFGRFYDELTATVRGYVARRFEIPADRQTSREFLDATRARGDFPDAEADRLRALLRLADLVKFARAEPTREECDGHLAEARRFVGATAPAATSTPTPGPEPAQREAAR